MVRNTFCVHEEDPPRYVRHLPTQEPVDTPKRHTNYLLVSMRGDLPQVDQEIGRRRSPPGTTTTKEKSSPDQITNPVREKSTTPQITSA
jgi:hypothetical protein